MASSKLVLQPVLFLLSASVVLRAPSDPKAQGVDVTMPLVAFGGPETSKAGVIGLIILLHMEEY